MSAPPGGGGRQRARDLGIVVGALAPGPLNAITDVPGVRVGHATLIRGEDIRTGVTAILPHNGNMLQERAPAAIFVGNGYGKLMAHQHAGHVSDGVERPGRQRADDDAQVAGARAQARATARWRDHGSVTTIDAIAPTFPSMLISRSYSPGAILC